ncbi:MAG: hypothetical protein JXB48_19280 [Candidatus Latescibacteria bacterium]|nr:hypothetical protein [Candidatus Latescibacterota bacterium]
MVEQINKAIYLAFGIGLTAKEKIEKAGQDLAKEWGLSKEAGKKMLAELRKRHEDIQKTIAERISDAVSEAINKLNVATKDEMKRLNERLTALELQVVRLSARSPEK